MILKIKNNSTGTSYGNDVLKQEMETALKIEQKYDNSDIRRKRLQKRSYCISRNFIYKI